MIRSIAGYLFIVAGAVSISLAVSGLVSGNVMLFSKPGHKVVALALDPNRFWLSVALWFLGGIALGIGGYVKFLRERR